MSVTLKNVSKQPVTIILDHPAFASREHGWQRKAIALGTSGDDGGVQVRETRRTLTGTLRVAPGESVIDLHPAIAKCSQSAALIANRVITLTEQPEEKQQPLSTDGKKVAIRKKETSE